MRLSNFRKRVLCASRAFAITALVFAGACTFAETASGFVTKIASPTDFYLSAQHVVMDGNTQYTTESVDENIGISPSPSHLYLVDRPEPKSRKAVPCASVLLATGSRVQIAGDAAGPDGSFHATQVTLYNYKIDQASL